MDEDVVGGGRHFHALVGSIEENNQLVVEAEWTTPDLYLALPALVFLNLSVAEDLRDRPV